MSAIREWASANGIEVGKRGRISHDVFEAYLLAHPAEARQFLKAQGLVVGNRGRLSPKMIHAAVSK